MTQTRKIDCIKALLPGKKVIGPSWITFSTVCPWEERAEHLTFLKKKLREFNTFPNKIVFFSDEQEEDLLQTDTGDRRVAITTVFVTVDGVPLNRCFQLDQALRDLFSAPTHELESAPR